MPLALILTIRPVAAGDVPSSLNRATHAAVLRLIGQADEALAERLHNDDGPRPLTVSNVLGLERRSGTVPVSPERSYGLRVTLLSGELEQLAAAWEPSGLGELDLEGTRWQVEQITHDPEAHPWAGQQSYEGLAAPALLRADAPPKRWMLDFAAPVTFRQSGRNQPFPLPELVFGSLLDRWNSFAPLALPDEVRRFAGECLVVSRYNLRSAAEPTKNGALQIGAVGRCTYTATNRDRYWLACIETLAQFAFYSGVGAGTARGMGQARLLTRNGTH
jgi:CRISPR-associated endoribonuclease Cas6